MRFATPYRLACLLFFAIPAIAEDPLEFPDGMEKRVMIHASYGFQKDGQWLIPLRLWVHEEPDTVPWLVADALKGRLADTAGLDELNAEQEAYFRERAFAFVADSESGETPVLIFDNDPSGRRHSLIGEENGDETDRNGLIEGFLTLDADEADAILEAQQSMDGWLQISVQAEEQFGTGRIRLVPAEGVSVISDIDDTIKVTEIPEGKQKVIYNTFFKELTPTSCMPTLYGQFAASIPFHYVSGAPWQLYGPLADFVMDAAAYYPAGSFHMKNVRTNIFESETYEDLFKLIGGSGPVTFEQKIGQISDLFRRFPGRQFVMIGDSGERDPEVFGRIRSEFPDQVLEIFIRDVVGDETSNPDRLHGMTVIPADFADQNECNAWVDQAAAPYR